MSFIQLALVVLYMCYVFCTTAQSQFQATSKTETLIRNLQSEINQLKSQVNETIEKDKRNAVKINDLENKNKQNEIQLNKLKERNAASSVYCDMHAVGKCGPCLCFDDYQLPQKYYCDCQNLPTKRDCLDHYQSGLRIDGIYRINMNGLRNVQAYCDQHSIGGGWTVIQRRMDGSENFYRNWTEYKHGFGKLHREFWWGNENTYYLTSVLSVLKGSEGMIELRRFGYSSNYYNRYSDFHVNKESHKYMLHVKTGSNYWYNYYLTSYCNNAPFSTYDRHNDKDSSYHCAQRNHGGWWYNSCSYYTNLNSRYDNRYSWSTCQDKFAWGCSRLQFSEIKVRRL